MNYRNKLYYPDSQIQKNLYTQGKEWMTLEDWKEYRGLYHRYITGETFTGPEWNAKTSKKLVTYRNRDESFFEYIDTKNYINSNGQKKEIMSSGVYNTNRYKAPRAIKRKTTDAELLKGVMDRYFVYKRNEPNRVFLEISDNQKSLYKVTNAGINQSLYGLLEFKWKLDGPQYDVFENGLLVTPGVFDTNKRIVLRHSQKFPKLAEVVTNFFEYTVYDV
jgi:hypothetical protein